MPGVLSFEFRRPPDGHQLFVGPYDDVAPGEDTYSPLQSRSEFCAPCHFGVFWGTVIYNSFGEWLESPYSSFNGTPGADEGLGKTCQDCHMPPLGATHFALPAKGGLARDPATIFSHRMPGAMDEDLLQNAVAMDTSAHLEGRKVVIQVRIINDQTGHHVPTDSPLRHLILLVNASDGQGHALPQVAGPTLPEWCGVGEPGRGYYAGLPGTAYAKILQDAWTHEAPTGAYWRPTWVLQDNRIPALGSDTTSYAFAAPEEGRILVDVRLLFRRAFIQLIDQKGWDVPDILMEREKLVLRE
jgi:hypothetical protein